METSESDGHDVSPSEALIIDRLVGILSGRRAVSDGLEVLDPDVLIRMDGLRFRGVARWHTWLRLLRESRRIEELDLVPDAVTRDGAYVKLEGRWRGWRNGVFETSPSVSARFLVREDRVVEISTKAVNYAFVLGDVARSLPGLICLLTYLFLRSSVLDMGRTISPMLHNFIRDKQ